MISVISLHLFLLSLSPERTTSSSDLRLSPLKSNIESSLSPKPSTPRALRTSIYGQFPLQHSHPFLRCNPPYLLESISLSSSEPSLYPSRIPNTPNRRPLPMQGVCVSRHRLPYGEDDKCPESSKPSSSRQFNITGRKRSISGRAPAFVRGLIPPFRPFFSCRMILPPRPLAMDSFTLFPQRVVF